MASGIIETDRPVADLGVGEEIPDAPEITPTAVPTEAVTPTVVPTETVTPAPTAEPSLTEMPTGVPEDIQEADEPEEMKIPLSARFGELPVSIRKVFEEKGRFIYVETEYKNYALNNGERYTMDSFQPFMSEADEHPEEYIAEPDSFTIIDLDRDGKNEIIVLLTNSHAHAEYLILSDLDGTAYGYMMVYWGSSGATSGQLYRFTAFTADGYETETLAVEDYPYYEIAGKLVSEELFYAFCKETLVDSVLWAPCDKICFSPDHTAWVKYSIDGTITLYYEDQVIDITDKFKEGLCYLYTIGSDGNEVYVSIQYKSEVVIDSNEFENDWKYYWGGYTTDDTKEKYTSVCDPYNPLDDSLEGTFRLDGNDRIRIWQGDLVFSSEYEIFVMEHYDDEDEQTYEIADNYSIWLFYPLCAEGAFATRDGFLHVLKETKVDCFYHLNEDGLIDDIRGIYYP